MADRPTRGESRVSDQIEEIVPRAAIERLRNVGYVVVPLRPSDDMVKVGAPLCYQPSAPTKADPWAVALSDAAECYRAMIELGCL